MKGSVAAVTDPARGAAPDPGGHRDRSLAAARSHSVHLHSVCTVHIDHVLVSVSGEADIATAPLLRRALDTALRYAHEYSVVVDLCGVGFMDSSGVQPLVEVDQRLHARRKRLWLACPHPRTGRMLRLLKLEDYFPVLPLTVPVPRCGEFDRGRSRHDGREHAVDGDTEASPPGGSRRGRRGTSSRDVVLPGARWVGSDGPWCDLSVRPARQ
ncbi:STAS domain-containing protein [Streptomyces sp. MS06]|uniref:STAS domain-containing protein n=1 Tax=Streptomyces sp. MS06 TaxID=3385974 RepID=UPI0039A207C6